MWFYIWKRIDKQAIKRLINVNWFEAKRNWPLIEELDELEHSSSYFRPLLCNVALFHTIEHRFCASIDIWSTLFLLVQQITLSPTKYFLLFSFIGEVVRYRAMGNSRFQSISYCQPRSLSNRQSLVKSSSLCCVNRWIRKLTQCDLLNNLFSTIRFQ